MENRSRGLYDIVPVIRCRDCAFFDPDPPAGCTLLDFAASDHANGFCKWGLPSIHPTTQIPEYDALIREASEWRK